MKTIVSLHSQYEIVKNYQFHESLRLVVSEALGGTSTSSNAVSPDDAIGSFDELAAAFSNIGGLIQ